MQTFLPSPDFAASAALLDRAYGLAMCAQGGADTVATTIVADLAAVGLEPPRTQAELAAAGLLPDWLGDERVHRSHRAALVAKDPAYYGPLFPDEPVRTGTAYHWPRSGRAV